MFTYLKERKERRERARELYSAIESQARLPVFYEDYGVPDTVDGRFEMISLHCFIMMRRLQAAGNKKLSQTLFDVFFKVMDRSLREQGVGDLGVPKHMKRMMQGFNGRANHYESALLSGNEKDLNEAITCNIYGTIENPDNAHIDFMRSYILQSATMETTDPVFADLEVKEAKRA